jgi:hypothetical protein
LATVGDSVTVATSVSVTLTVTGPSGVLTVAPPTTQVSLQIVSATAVGIVATGIADAASVNRMDRRHRTGVTPGAS